jgi:acylpyruvate hydrolase
VKLATITAGGTMTAARIEGDVAVCLPYPDVGTLLNAGEHWPEFALGDGRQVALREAGILPTVVSPEKILCVGINHPGHAAELRRPVPQYPALFSKLPRTLIGAYDPILLPDIAVASEFDWEIELAVVIGRRLKRASTQEASAAIAGYCVANDISARDWQRRTSQAFQGKNFEATSPIGPWLTTSDEVDPNQGELICEVNGVIRQQSLVSDYVFRSEAVISYISTFTTLVPGDVIFLGTPEGTGAASTPPCHLHDGDVVRSTVTGLGDMVNVCVRRRS